MALLDILLPIVGLALIGNVTARLGWFSARDINALSKFSYGLLIPCLLFINTAETELNLRASLNLLAGYYAAALLTFFTAIGLAKILFNYNAREQSVFAMGATYPNATVIGIPVVLQSLGPEALTGLFIIISIQNLVLFSLGTLFAERENLSFSNVLESINLLLRQLLRNPITLGLVAGLLVNLLSVPLPTTVSASLHLFSSAAVPTALFVLGASMTQYQIRDQWQAATAITLLKLVVTPLSSWFMLFYLLDIPPRLAAAGLLASAMPVGINAYAFASRYQCGLAPIAAGTLLSAITSLATVSLILIYLASLGL